MICLMILRQNHSINHKLNATSIVLRAGPTPRGLQGPASQGPCRPLHEWPTVKSASVYAPRMKVIHAFGGIFPVTEKVIYTFLYYYVIDNRRYI